MEASVICILVEENFLAAWRNIRVKFFSNRKTKTGEGQNNCDTTLFTSTSGDENVYKLRAYNKDLSWRYQYNTSDLKLNVLCLDCVILFSKTLWF